MWSGYERLYDPEETLQNVQTDLLLKLRIYEKLVLQLRNKNAALKQELKRVQLEFRECVADRWPYSSDEDVAL